jgi:hypothetical protein
MVLQFYNWILTIFIEMNILVNNTVNIGRKIIINIFIPTVVIIKMLVLWLVCILIILVFNHKKSHNFVENRIIRNK